MGGNSGSVVIDLDSGKAIGLHFSGSFLTTNYAVRADVVKQLLDRVRSGTADAPRNAGSQARAPPPTIAPRQAPVIRRQHGAAVVASVTIPLTVTVSTVAGGATAPQRGSPQHPLFAADRGRRGYRDGR